MAMTMQEERKGGTHRLVLEERGILTATGVSNVDSFDDTVIVAYTDLGELTIRGENLQISAMIYTDNQPKSAGILKKLFR